MGSATDLQTSIQESANWVTLAELLTRHPGIARRTTQRLIAKLIESELVIARGEGRARRYFAAGTEATVNELIGGDEIFPDYIPVSADSQDVLTYIEQPQKAREPVGFQKDFLDSYHPNETGYLSDSLHRQLHKMGKTTVIDELV